MVAARRARPSRSTGSAHRTPAASSAARSSPLIRRAAATAAACTRTSRSPGSRPARAAITSASTGSARSCTASHTARRPGSVRESAMTAIAASASAASRGSSGGRYSAIRCSSRLTPAGQRRSVATTASMLRARTGSTQLSLVRNQRHRVRPDSPTSSAIRSPLVACTPCSRNSATAAREISRRCSSRRRSLIGARPRRVSSSVFMSLPDSNETGRGRPRDARLTVPFWQFVPPWCGS